MNVSFNIIIFGAIFTLLHGVEQIAGRARRTKIDYLTAIVMADVALILYNHAIMATDGLQKQLSLIFYLTSIYAIGPLNYLYYYSLLHNTLTISIHLLSHLLPASVIFCLELIYYLSPTHVKENIISSIYSQSINVFSILLFLGGILFVLYQLYFIYQCSKVFNDVKIRKGLYLTLILESINITTPIPVLLWLITKKNHYYAIAGYMTIAVIVILFLTNRRFPLLFHRIADAIRNKKYERNYLSNINKEYLHHQLLNIMKNEKLYLDPEINLESLSYKLNVTPHQLSQFLNEYCHMRFNHFVNKYRIEEAKNILSMHPDANIISVAYHVGFNSKSTFNKIFKQYTGKTPSSFKEGCKNSHH
ncbi:MAG TPA: helix-turn-helix transcriptional regulator [Spirochaetota bacterium]|nr:helix-turn-helix transcriptional regulator [Spirochaetota bacterium]HOM11260.1 helix-turn-helix transcriptional regulator [Spirochaetota bacterium]HPP50067.1 helix-turn-helix transcriptional regulator [Spirochaetota bacterium]